MSYTSAFGDTDASARRTATDMLPFGRFWTVVVTVAAGIGVAVIRISHRSELVAPIDPNLHAFAIFVGVFSGILGGVAGFGWWRRRIGSESFAGSRNPLRPLIAGAIMPVLCCLCTSYAARRWVEYRAFHGWPVATELADFTVIGMGSGRSGHHLTVRLAPGDREIALPVGSATYYAAQEGDRLALPIQHGRGGVERMVPPDHWPTPTDLHHR